MKNINYDLIARLCGQKTIADGHTFFRNTSLDILVMVNDYRMSNLNYKGFKLFTQAAIKSKYYIRIKQNGK